MTRQKRATATVKMNYTDDVDLIAWWDSLPRGSRNAVMKDMMRDYIEHHQGSYRPIIPQNIPVPFDPRRFTQISEDAAWIKAMLMNLPKSIEQMIQRIGGGGVIHQVDSNLPSSNEESSEVAVQQRETRMKKTTW